jgi:restriction system protein
VSEAVSSSSSPQDGPIVSLDLRQQIQNHNKEVSAALHKKLLNMEPSAFESLIGELLIAIGFEDVEVTSRSADGGIDVRGTLVVGEVIRTKMAVQVKRWQKNVQSPTVQQVRGSLGAHDHGLIITTSNFSSGAREEARRANAIPVALMGGEQLLRLLVENNLGVRRTKHDLLELGDLSG